MLRKVKCNTHTQNDLDVLQSDGDTHLQQPRSQRFVQVEQAMSEQNIGYHIIESAWVREEQVLTSHLLYSAAPASQR